MAAEETIVGGHVTQAMAAEVEDDALFRAVSRQRRASLIGAADGVRSFRRGNDAFGAGEQLGRLEAFDLMERRGLDQPKFGAPG